MKALVISRKEYCPYCVKAKALLDMKGIEYTEKTIGLDYTKEQLLEILPTARTVPQVWLDETYIGGYDALESHFKS